MAFDKKKLIEECKLSGNLDNKKVLFQSKTEWNRILSRAIPRAQLDENERLKEQGRIEQNKIAKRNIIKKWPEFVENVVLRRKNNVSNTFKETEEDFGTVADYLLEAEVEDQKSAGFDRIKSIRQRRKLEMLHKRECNENLKKAEKLKQLNISTNNPVLMLNKALLITETYRIRDEQLKLEKTIQKKKNEEEAKFAKCVIEQDKVFNEGQIKAAMNARKNCTETKNILLAQIEENQARIKKENEEKLAIGKEETSKSTEEINHIKKLQEEQKRENIQDMKKYMKTVKERLAELRDHDKSRNEELNNIGQLVFDMKVRRCENIKKLRNEMIKKRGEVFTERYNNFIRRQKLECKRPRSKELRPKMEEDELKRAQVKDKQRVKFREDLQKYNESFEREKQRRMVVEKEMHSYELANRFKKDEIDKKHNEKRAAYIKQLNIDLKNYNLKQYDEFKGRQKELKEYDNQAPEKEGHFETDKRFFNYAKEIIDDLKKQGRSDITIRKTINNYCKSNLLPPFNYSENDKKKC